MKAISKYHILVPYLIIPIGLLLIGVDVLFLQSGLQKTLPSDPHSLFVINLLFGLPHVVAGDIQLLDREYLKFHRLGLIVCLIISAAFPISLISVMGLTTFITVEFIIGIFHAGGQQMGIVGMFSSFNRKYFNFWKWSGRFALVLTAIRMACFDSISASLLPKLDALLLVTFLGHLFAGLHMMKGCDRKIGRVYITSNLLMTFMFFIFHFLNYPCLSIFTLRLPHDLTAFLFYINHSTLRNEKENHNWVVRTLHIPKKVGGYFLPLLAIPIAFAVQSWEAIFLFDAFLSFMHFTSESFVWKHTSPAFKFLKVV